MAGWQTHEGLAVALPLANVDTDQLIPARFMSTPRTQGYGDYLLHDMRRDDSGALKPDFPLNTNTVANVLVAGPNFGSGSSREAAVYALVDAGFHAVFAPSFGDIFAGNAVNNALLPARIDEAACTQLLTQLESGTCTVTIDLETRRATFGTTKVSFALSGNWQTKLLNGWDDIDLTQTHAPEIRAFKETYAQTVPWALPAALD